MDGSREPDEPAGLDFGPALLLVETDVPAFGLRRLGSVPGAQRCTRQQLSASKAAMAILVRQP